MAVSATWQYPGSSSSTVHDTVSARASMSGRLAPPTPSARRYAAWIPPVGSQVIRPGWWRCTEKQLVLFQPAHQGGLDRLALAPDHPLRRDGRGPDEAVEEPAGARVDDPRPFLEQRLLEVASGIPTSRPSASTSSGVRPSPISRSAVCSSAAR